MCGAELYQDTLGPLELFDNFNLMGRLFYKTVSHYYTLTHLCENVMISDVFSF